MLQEDQIGSEVDSILGTQQQEGPRGPGHFSEIVKQVEYICGWGYSWDGQLCEKLGYDKNEKEGRHSAEEEFFQCRRDLDKVKADGKKTVKKG